MIKNDPVAARRRVYIRVESDDDGSSAPRGTSFASCSWLDQSTGSLVATSGTLTNNRRALTFADLTVTVVDPATDQLTIPGHGLDTGDGDVLLQGVGPGQPAGTTNVTPYYAIVVDANTIKIATSAANAYAGVAVDITSAGSGVIVLHATATCQRGIDGDFMLQLIQSETNFDGDYLVVFVEKPTGATFWRGRAFVKMENVGSLWDTVLGADGATAGDMQRHNYRANGAGKLLRVGTAYTLRNETDTKDAAHGTITEAGGRTEAVIDDATI